jgi:hypothetical protein
MRALLQLARRPDRPPDGFPCTRQGLAVRREHISQRLGLSRGAAGRGSRCPCEVPARPPDYSWIRPSKLGTYPGLRRCFPGTRRNDCRFRPGRKRRSEF